MFKIFIFSLLLSLSCHDTNSQEKYEFRVMAVYGQVEYKTGKNDNNDWMKLRIGTSLDRNNYIRINSGYLCLLHKAGSTLELTSDKIYKVSGLKKLIKQNVDDYKRNLAKFIYDKITETITSDKEANSELNSVGGVERKIEINNQTENKLHAVFPKNSKVVDDEIPFCWSNDGSKMYTFMIKDKFDKLVFTTETKDTFMTVNVKALNLSPGNCFYWEVKSGLSSSKQYCILPVNPKEISEIKKGADKIFKSSNPESPIDNIIIATYYSEKKVVYKAAEYYLKAIRLAPSVTEYKQLYDSYINISTEE